MVKCGKCSKVIDKDVNIVNCINCSFCNMKFHTDCVNLSENLFKTLLNRKPNILWRCDYCSNCDIIAIMEKLDFLCSEILLLKETVMHNLNKSHMFQKSTNNIKVDNKNNGNSILNQTFCEEKQKSYSDVVKNIVEGVDAITDNVENVINTDKMVNINKNAIIVDAAAEITCLKTPKRRRKNQKTRSEKDTPQLVVGDSSTADGLEIVEKLSWIHVSNFSPTTTEDAIIKYTADKFKVSTKDIKCFKLVKKDANLDLLRFVSFKLGLPSSFLKNVFEPSNWPAGSVVKSFVSNPKNLATEIVSKIT